MKDSRVRNTEKKRPRAKRRNVSQYKTPTLWPKEQASHTMRRKCLAVITYKVGKREANGEDLKTLVGSSVVGNKNALTNKAHKPQTRNRQNEGAKRCRRGQWGKRPKWPINC